MNSKCGVQSKRTTVLNNKGISVVLKKGINVVLNKKGINQSVSVLFYIDLYNNCFGRTVLYVCVEYCI